MSRSEERFAGRSSRIRRRIMKRRRPWRRMRIKRRIRRRRIRSEQQIPRISLRAGNPVIAVIVDILLETLRKNGCHSACHTIVIVWSLIILQL